MIMEIKRLLYDEKLTIEGARRRLKQYNSKTAPVDRTVLKEIRSELQDVLKVLA